MSRIGKKPVAVPAGVKVTISGRNINVEGKGGSLSYICPHEINVVLEGDKLEVSVAGTVSKTARELHGLVRSLIANMIEGVDKGYTKELEIDGVGFKAEIDDKFIKIFAGFAASVNLVIPEGLDVKVNDGTKIVVQGADKQSVGDFAARIRRVYPAEPYKGKGIKYKDEHIRRKAGKTVA